MSFFKLAGYLAVGMKVFGDDFADIVNIRETVSLARNSALQPCMP